MRPDIPWNVAGIPPEAREAARAAARREGLSVGEWMTRRILRSFSDSPDEEAPTREAWSSNGNGYGASEPRAAQTRRDTEDMLARVARSESESNDIYRRIEEQLRNVARRLESAERNQAENNRAMSKAAAEINIAAREQAQAFDQLGGSVTGLADRLERVERSATQDGTRDAIKGLHNGLSRLADQITTTANQSASQISALASNLESLAGRLAQARQEAEQATHAIDRRVSQIDHKVALIDQSLSQISTLDERLRAVERAAQASNEVLTHAVQSIEARKDEEAAALRRDTETASAIARLEDNLSRLDARGSDPAIDRRLSSIERSLSDIVTRFESAGTVEADIKHLTQRIDLAETRQRDQMAELRAVLHTAPPHADPFEPAPMAAAAAPPVFTPQQSFEGPPFTEPPGQAFQVSADAFAPASDPAGAPPFAAEAAFGQNLPQADPFGAASAAAEPENYLTAARRSARAAAAQTEAERGNRIGSFTWGAAATMEAENAGSSKKTYLWIAIVALLAIIAIAAGAVLSQKLSPNSPSSVSALFPKSQTAPAKPAPLQKDTTGPTAIKPSTAEVKPLQTYTVTPVPVHPVPAPVVTAKKPPATASATPAKPSPATAVAPLDKLTQLANAGNAKAELVVGLKYLDGDGVAVNEGEAAKWLQRAAELGLAVAQYRLGTLYERGRGVPADMARAVHWYQLAAQAGNRKAMHNLAVAYATGAGIEKNLAEAARWFSKAAALGLADSEFNLAVLYERGMGVPQSLIDAYKWYAIAAASGDTQSKARIDALSTQLSSDDRAAAQRAAESFHAQTLDPKANVAPQMGEVVQ